MRPLALQCLALLSSLLLFVSCDDDEPAPSTTETVDATLLWTGDVAVDGCGFMLRFGGEDHKPVNEGDIPAHYKTESPVEVEARIENLHQPAPYNCGFNAAPVPNGVRILSLRSR